MALFVHIPHSGHSVSTHTRFSAASFPRHAPGSPNDYHSIMYHSEHLDDTICSNR